MTKARGYIKRVIKKLVSVFKDSETKKEILIIFGMVFAILVVRIKKWIRRRLNE